MLRQALAGMLWGKQFFHYDVARWLDGDPAGPPPPAARRRGRNAEWRHLNNRDVISMPDPWEYPWYAAWDLAFHCVPLARVDPRFAKDQLVLLLREWYTHPGGQLPAYEWAFGDVNPPVHAWAALRVFEIDGARDVDFLARVFHKLLINFTWWVNRKDSEGDNVFEGGFLGLDNIGPIDRSAALPVAGVLEQSDGTAWMAMYCLNMLEIALVLARRDPAYQDVATKFFEHFALIATAAYGMGLWDEQDGFFHDVLSTAGRPGRADARAVDGRAAAAVRDHHAGQRDPGAPAAVRRALLLVRGEPAGGRGGRGADPHPPRGRGPAAVHGRGRCSCSGSSRRCSTSRSSCPRTACALSLGGTWPRRSCSTCPSCTRRSTTSPPSRRPACSAATPTGAGPSGSRSTSW